MWNIASRVELLFVLSAVRTNYILVALHVYFSTRVYPRSMHVSRTGPRKNRLYELHYPISFYLRDLLPSIKCIAHSMIIDNCFQDFIEEFVNLNCVLLYLSILRTYNNNNHQNDYYYYYKIFISFIIYKYVYKVKKKSYNLT